MAVDKYIPEQYGTFPRLAHSISLPCSSFQSFPMSLAINSHSCVSQSAHPQQQCTKPLLTPSLAQALQGTLQSLAGSSRHFFTFDYACNHVNIASLYLC